MAEATSRTLMTGGRVVCSNVTFSCRDRLSKCCSSSCFHFQGVLLIIEVITHVADIVTNIMLAIELSDKGRGGFAGLVIGINFFPPIATFMLILAKKCLPDKWTEGESYRYTVFGVDWLCEDTFYGSTDERGPCRSKRSRIILRIILIWFRVNRFLSNGRLLLYQYQERLRCLRCSPCCDAQSTAASNGCDMQMEVRECVSSIEGESNDIERKLVEEMNGNNGNKRPIVAEDDGNPAAEENLKDKERKCKTIAEAEYLVDGLFSIIPQMWLSFYFFGEESAVSWILIVSTLISFVDCSIWIGQSQYWRFVKITKYSNDDDDNSGDSDDITKEGVTCLKALMYGNIALIPFYMLTTIPAISLYAGVQSEYVMFAHVLLYVVLFKEIWWWRRKSLLKEINISFRLMYLLFKIFMKVLVFVMICVWFVRVMLYVARDDATVPYAVPSWVWPNTRPFLKNIAIYGPYPNRSQPLWKRPCNVTRTSTGGVKEEIEALAANNICNADVAPYLFCIVFWMNNLYFLFDVIRFFVVLICKWRYNDGKEKRKEKRIMKDAIYYSKVYGKMLTEWCGYLKLPDNVTPQLLKRILELKHDTPADEWMDCIDKLRAYDGFLCNDSTDPGGLFPSKRWTFLHHAARHQAEESVINYLIDKMFVTSLKDSEGLIPYDHLPDDASPAYKGLFIPKYKIENMDLEKLKNIEVKLHDAIRTSAGEYVKHDLILPQLSVLLETVTVGDGFCFGVPGMRGGFTMEFQYNESGSDIEALMTSSWRRFARVPGQRLKVTEDSWTLEENYFV